MDTQSSPEKKTKTLNPFKIVAIVLVTLFALYVLILSVISPIVIKHYANKSINEYTHWTLVLNDVRIDPFDLTLEIDQFNLFSPDSKREIGFASLLIDIEISDTLYSLFFEEAFKPVVRTISLVAPYSHIELETDGSMLISKRIKPVSEHDTSAENEEEQSSATLAWLIQEIVINGGQFEYLDQQPKAPFRATLSEVSIAIDNLNNDFSTALPYQLSLRLNQAPIKLAGMLSIDPFTTNGELSLDGLNLNSFQSYIGQFSNIELNQGLLSLQSTFDLTQNTTMNGTINLNLTLDQLDTTTIEPAQPLLGFKQLSIGPVDIQLSPLAVNIGDIALNKPKLLLTIDSQKKLNLASLAAPTESENVDSETNLSEVPSPVDDANEETKQVEMSAQAEDDQGPKISLTKLSVSSGHIDILDQSVSPEFTNSIDDLNIVLRDYSPGIPTKFELDTKLLNTGSLKAEGELVSPGHSPDGRLALSLTHIDLNQFSAYSQHFVGYPISEGTLNFDTKYLIESEQLDAIHDVYVDKLEFKKQVSNDPVVSAPLPLIVGILEDKDQLIQLNVPAKGDLSDPEVDVFSLVINAFTRFFTKIITSPFSMLAGALDIEEDISNVAFEPGKSVLNASQSRLIKKLASALSSRPKLNLSINCTADREIDGLALAKELQTKMAEQNQNQTVPLPVDTTSVQNEEIKPQPELALPPIDDSMLIKLASDRGAHIKEYMLNTAKLPADRLTLHDETIVDQSNKKTKNSTACQFSLE